jgi:hypothetical protein
MVRPIILFLTMLLSFACLAQGPRTPVYLSRTGQDSVGVLFEAALKQELSRSTRYTPRNAEGAKGKFEFVIELATVDVADDKAEQGKRSVVSIVIEDFGLPNSYPVATMWYHKVIVVDKNSVSKLAKDLLDDMDARWCSYLKNSIGGCPKEKFYPQL